MNVDTGCWTEVDLSPNSYIQVHFNNVDYGTESNGATTSTGKNVVHGEGVLLCATTDCTGGDNDQDDDENSGVGSCVRTIKYKLDAQDDERAHASGGGGRCDPKQGVSRVIGDGYADDAAVGLHSKEIPINFVSAEDDEKDLPIALTYHPEDSPNGDGGTTVVLEGELITAITVAALVLVLALAIVMFYYRTCITSIKYCIGCVTAIVLGVFSCFEVSPRRGTFPFFQLPPAFLLLYCN